MKASTGPIQQALDALDTLADYIVADRAEVRDLVDNADSDAVAEAVIALIDAYEAGDDLDAHIVALVSVVLGLPEDPDTELEPVTVDVTVDVLLVTGLVDHVRHEDVAAWTQEQREQAADWAGAVHVHASDHDDVEVPPMPQHVADLRERAGGERG